MSTKTPIEVFRDTFLERRIFVPLLLVAAGYTLVMLPYFTGLSLQEILTERGPKYLGYGLTGLGVIWFYLELISRYVRSKRDGRFSDVDARRRGQSSSAETQKILDELESLKVNQQAFDYDKLESLVQGSIFRRQQIEKEKYNSFSGYFESISRLLEDQAQTASEKASILLDKGTAYSKNGILFFVVTIVVWQVLSYFIGFKTQHIYGIASCSLLFIFIEFLSAWFLKQYRHYVDTSTYLIKVKSIFDRYMLAYLALSRNESGGIIGLENLISMLSDDIKWPESYLMKNPDISFAKEALDTMSHFAKSMKSEARGDQSSNRGHNQ